MYNMVTLIRKLTLIAYYRITYTIIRAGCVEEISE